MSQRFTEAHVAAWKETGFTIIPRFFSEDEIAPIRQEFEGIYGTTGQGPGAELNVRKTGGFGEFREAQFQNIDTFPYDASFAMNLISLHPQLIELAKQLLDSPSVHLYQAHTWAKYTGDADYNQAHHCDFSNHTLLVPGDQCIERTVDVVIYMTEVTDAHGALHFVTKPDSNRVLRPGAVWAVEPEQQTALNAVERSAAGPAGTIVAHSIDTFHRGTNLTEPGGHRFTMTAGYKSAGNDMIGYHVWQDAASRDWRPIFEHATPEQLKCLGIPPPGSEFWNERTLKLSQARWPNWNMAEYFRAAGVQPLSRTQPGSEVQS